MWAAATLAIAILRSIFALGRPPISEDIRQLILRMATDALPPRPEARQGDPEGAIQRRETRPSVPMGVDRELLPECELDDRLALATPEVRILKQACRSLAPGGRIRPSIYDGSAGPSPQATVEFAVSCLRKQVR